MKKKVLIISAVAVLAIVIAIGLFLYVTSSRTHMTLSPDVCQYYFGKTPEEFCKNDYGYFKIYDIDKSEVMFYMYYVDAKVSDDGSLILTMTDEQIKSWRETQTSIEALSIIGMDTGAEFDEKAKENFEFVFGDISVYEYDVAEDFTRVVTNMPITEYRKLFNVGCLFMQLTSGVPSDQAKFEYVIVNDDGKVIFQKTSDYSTLIEEYKAQQGGK